MLQKTKDIVIKYLYEEGKGSYNNRETRIGQIKMCEINLIPYCLHELFRESFLKSYTG